jgi:hypothetical protein
MREKDTTSCSSFRVSQQFLSWQPYVLLPLRQRVHFGSPWVKVWLDQLVRFSKAGFTLLSKETELPLIGNLLQIPARHSWLYYHELAQKYGPIFGLDIMGRKHVIVSTEQIANDLLRERGNIYSSREQLPMGAQLMSGNLRPLLLPYGSK